MHSAPYLPILHVSQSHYYSWSCLKERERANFTLERIGVVKQGQLFHGMKIGGLGDLLLICVLDNYQNERLNWREAKGLQLDTFVNAKFKYGCGRVSKQCAIWELPFVSQSSIGVLFCKH